VDGRLHPIFLDDKKQCLTKIFDPSGFLK